MKRRIFLLVLFCIFPYFVMAEVLRVGLGSGIIPFVYNNEYGDLVGFDVDIVNELGKVTGYDIVFEQMEFSALIPAVQSGNIDLLATAMTITNKRAEKVDFTIPYSTGPGAVILTSLSNNSIKKIEDLKGQKVAVILGSANADYLKSQKIGAELVEFSNIADCYLALVSGRVVATINPLESAKMFIADKGKNKVKIVGKEIPISGIGMAVKKGNKKLLRRINEGIKKLIENGKRDELEAKYFSELTEEDKKILK